MKRSIRILITLLIILVGAGLAVYPLVSNHLYEESQKEAIKVYEQQTENIQQEEKERELQRARDYNKALLNKRVILTDPFDPNLSGNKDIEEYNTLLNTSADGSMGYLEIPALELYVSIYHGTGTRALEAGVGHLEETSLPVGGEGTHAVLSAHTGLPGKKLFTDLELLEEKDIFLIHILGETIAYEVDQIKVVEPHNTSDLVTQIEQDYVTLLTCTPYGVNSHRLLVRGHRIPYEKEVQETVIEEIPKKTGSQWMRQYSYGILIGTALLVFVLVFYWLYSAWRDRRERLH